MKYDITYSCGHDGMVDLVGKRADRERKLKWMADEGLCPVCYKKWKAEQDEKKIEKVLEHIALPKLMAKSEKQLDYAEEKRRQYIIYDSNNRLGLLYDVMHPTDEQRQLIAEQLIAKGVTYDDFINYLTKKMPVANAVLTETDAGKLLDVLLTSAIEGMPSELSRNTKK